MVELVCAVTELYNDCCRENENTRNRYAFAHRVSEKQRKYQRAVPDVDVPAELFNQWEDCFFPGDDTFQSAFQPAELEALHRFNDVLEEVCGETPRQLPRLDEFCLSGSWRKLSEAANATLGALGVREVQP